MHKKSPSSPLPLLLFFSSPPLLRLLAHVLFVSSLRSILLTPTANTSLRLRRCARHAPAFRPFCCLAPIINIAARLSALSPGRPHCRLQFEFRHHIRPPTSNLRRSCLIVHTIPSRLDASTAVSALSLARIGYAVMPAQQELRSEYP